MGLAKWHKVDFHTHTPASSCFSDKTVTAEQWIEAAKNAGLDGVVITDHNSVGFISAIDEVDEEIKKDITIFYGIELCVSAEFTHIIVIFDEKMSVQQIEDIVIRDLGISRDNWGNTSISVTEDKLKKLCNEQRNHILVIPAHFASEKGLAKCRENAIKQYKEFVRFDAIEVRNEEDLREYNNKVKNKAIDPTALITGSDNPSDKDPAVHSIEGFGKAFTWVKVSQLSFEGLRQVFLDPENRCKNMLDLKEIGVDYNPNVIAYNYVAGIRLKGFSHVTEDLSIRFSPNLNCVIGGRGTGKSTIVDAINYGLKVGTELSACKLLDKTLKKDGTITTFYNFGDSSEYMATATRKGKDNTLLFTYENNAGPLSDPPEFKIDFYGQKEIYNLLDEENVSTEERSPLVTLIDSRIHSRLFTVKDNINNTVSLLLQKASLYRGNLAKIAELPKIKAEIEKSEALLNSFKASGLEDIRKRLEKIDGVVKNINNEYYLYLDNLKIIYANSLTREEKYNTLIDSIKNEPDNSTDVIIFLEKLKESNMSLSKVVGHEMQMAEEAKKQFAESTTIKERDDLNDEYLSLLENLKGIGSEEIKLVQSKLNEFRERETTIKTLGDENDTIYKEIADLIEKLVKYNIELTEIRKSAINEMDFDGVHFTISSMAHVKRFKASLQKELNKDSFEEDFNKLAETILDGKDDFRIYKNYLRFLLTTDTGDLSEFVNTEQFNGRFCAMWKEKYKVTALDSLLNVIPEDKVDITITDNGNEIDINEGSPGQKCAALLTYILNNGDNPLVIDQPEDDLDNSLIYNLIVKSIRKVKSKRQVIVVTHNPNIPVLGDAEGIIILERDSTGKVSFRNKKSAGCIEEKLIREGICDIMEGGVDAFKKREAKYMSVDSQ